MDILIVMSCRLLSTAMNYLARTEMYAGVEPTVIRAQR